MFTLLVYLDVPSFHTILSTDDLKCPSGQTKDFCDGWKSTARYNVTEYKDGLVAGEKNSQDINFTSWRCPAGHSRSYCSGWYERSCSLAGGDCTCVNPVQPAYTKDCVDDRNYKG